ncbi:MAG: phospholipase D/Transphosphatidylase [Verrucomicrobia bacterium]|nr:phospholipase D/Transphosphatidylase [Verrucomicrobiota bacterium]
MSTTKDKRKALFFRRKPSVSRPVSKRAGKPGRTSRWWILAAVVAFFGAYFWYTSARRLQVPIQVGSYGVDSAPFIDTVGPILGANFTAGNSVQILVNGDHFFPEMLKAIRGAKKTITLETYIWAPGKISDEFIEALSERARAGVKVHVMMDGMGTLKFKHADRARLEAAGIELMKYGREHWYEIKPNIMHRTHRKLLIVDGKVGFTGGMCIDDHWMGNADSSKVWRETQVRVEGPVVLEMQAVFAANWLQTTSKLLIGPEYFPKISPAGPSLAQCVKSGPGEGQENIRMSYLCAIAAAKKSIEIGNAYFVPDDLEIEMLIAARQRGVRVRVVVPAINDSRFGRAVSRSRWDALLAAGIEFYEYQPAMFHSKTMVVDDVFTIIGSANFDNRSFSINDEDSLNIIDANVARENLKAFENDVKQSHPISLEEFRHRGFFIRAMDHVCGLFRSQF